LRELDVDRLRAIAGEPAAGDEDNDEGGEGKGSEDGEIEPPAQSATLVGMDIEIGMEADEVVGVAVASPIIIVDDDGDEELVKGMDDVKDSVLADAACVGDPSLERGVLPPTGDDVP
jgi:hypothetical protein